VNTFLTLIKRISTLADLIYRSQPRGKSFMTIISGKSSSIRAAMATSLLFHLALFGVTAAMPSWLRSSSVAREYIPVELVQLTVPPRYAASRPAAVRTAAIPRPVKAHAPVASREHPEPAPPPLAQKIAPPTPPDNGAPAAGSSPASRGAAAPGGTGTAHTGGAGNMPSPSRSGAVPPQPQAQKLDKGIYQAFHKLTRLPTFKSRSEPVYPSPERMIGSEARVLAEIYLDEHGAVDEVAIKKSGGRLFDRAVIDAVLKSSFHPGYLGEKAVPTVIQIPYTFKLR
jgi:TonB family protein